MIYDTRNLYRDSIGWYRKKFNINQEQLKHRTSLRFDGVYMDSTIFINGKQAYEWKYGYSTFEFDIMEFLQEGLNEVLVRVVYQHCNSRWHSGAGIYRNVWIKTYEDEHLLADGIYITTIPLEKDVFRVEIETEIHIVPEEKGERILRQTIFDPDQKEVASISMHYSPEKSIRKVPATPDSEEAFVFFQYINIEKPLLWDIGQGNVYTLKTELIRDNEVIEAEEKRFGFRVMRFDSHEGFFINGRNVKLNGVCEHHDLGCLGAAFNKDAMRRKFKILRGMGVNAIRTAHNIPAPDVMDLADELGFLILSEAFDMWEMSKTPYDYGRFFKEWCERDVRSWIRRDRNCPSLLMWSIGNEIYDTQASEYGQEITKRLIKAVREHDPKKNAPITIGSNYMKWENGQACSKLVDVIGYNYGEDLYAEHHEKHPDWVIYGSETSSMLSSRGIYHFPLERSILTDEDEQCSALGNSVTGWGAMSYEETIFNDHVYLVPVVFDEEGWFTAGENGTTRELMKTDLLDVKQKFWKEYTFENTKVGKEWCFLLNPHMENYEFTDKYFLLNGTDVTLSDGSQSPTFIGMCQRELNLTVSCKLQTEAQEAGITMYMSPEQHYEIAVKKWKDDYNIIRRL